MTATLDANVLLYASDAASDRQERAEALLLRFAAGPDLLYLFWPVVMAYLRISTHPSIFDHPLDPVVARRNIAALLSRPHVRSPGEQDGFWPAFQRVVEGDVVRGNLVPDAHLVALMRQHGVGTIWTADRDFQRFDGVAAKNPFT